MENRWILTTEVKNKYTPTIKEFIDKINNMTTKEIENSENTVFKLYLSDTELKPYTLLKLMEELGYKKESMHSNGWENNFNIRISKQDGNGDICDQLIILGCGMVFELSLAVEEFV